MKGRNWWTWVPGPLWAGDLSRQPTLPYLVLAERPPVGPNKTGAT